MPKMILCSLALLGGICVAMQAPINAQLAAGLRSPITAAGISFLTGFLFLLGVSLAVRAPLPETGAISAVPTYAWFAGGALGAVFVGLNLYIVPQLGVATLISLAITGQLVASVALDHFGLFGLPIHPFNLARALGIVLLILGGALVMRF
jgi:transporter family-2 protein